MPVLTDSYLQWSLESNGKAFRRCYKIAPDNESSAWAITVVDVVGGESLEGAKMGVHPRRPGLA